jgi:hypothetical protein
MPFPQVHVSYNLVGQVQVTEFSLTPNIDLGQEPPFGTNIIWEAENYEGVVIVRLTQIYGSHIDADTIEVFGTYTLLNRAELPGRIEQFLDEALG